MRAPRERDVAGLFVGKKANSKKSVTSKVKNRKADGNDPS